MTSGGVRFTGYTLGEFLGNGLAGRVHTGRQAGSGIEVAIEVIPPPLGADRAFRRRLTAEALRAAALDHPLILRVHHALTAGEDEVGVVTDPYRGVPLAAIVPEHGLPVATAVLVADAVLLALVQAHRAGVVHRAVAPETVIVDEAGRIMLAGFALGCALHHDVPATPSTDTRAVAALAAGAVRGGREATDGALPRQLRAVLRRGTSESAKRRYQTAAGMRTALATAARHAIGPDWRELAASELAALFSGQGGDVDGTDLLLDLPPTPPLHPPPTDVTRAAEAPPSAAEAEQVEELPLSAPPGAAPAVVPVTPVIRGVPEMRRPRRLHSVLVATGVVAACVAIGVIAGLIVSAARGGQSVAAGPLRIGAPVSLKVEPVQGSCNSVFIATATGSVQGQGTLVYRWERSDGLASANTPLSVSPSDSSFLITQHWELTGAVSHPAITFRVVSPVPMTVTRELQYSCP